MREQNSGPGADDAPTPPPDRTLAFERPDLAARDDRDSGKNSTLPLPASPAAPVPPAVVSATGRRRMLRPALIVLAVLLLALLVAARSGAGGALLVVGLALVAAAGATLRRRRPAAAPAGRRLTAGLVGALGLVVLFAGAGVSTAPASSSSPAPRAAPPLARALPATTTAPQAPPAPTLALDCPASGATARFVQSITATGPYTVAIDYGDGQAFRGDDRHLAETFGHIYRTPGSFRVSALVTDASGATAAASCTYTWTAPAPAAPTAGRPADPPPAPAVSTAGSSTPAGSTPAGSAAPAGPTSGRSYTNVDGNRISSPVTASSAPAGATARCKDGSYSFSQHRQGTCSGHDGVAAWL